MSQLGSSGSSEVVINEPGGRISIGELAAVIVQGWKLVTACVLIAIVTAVALYFVIPPKWKAVLTVQIGKIPAKTTEYAIIESPDQLVARISSRTFQESVLFDTAQKVRDWEAADVTVFTRSLKVLPTRNADFVEISFAGYSKDDLNKVGGALKKQILATHSVRYEEARKRMDSNLAEVRQQIENLRALRVRLDGERQNGVGNGSGEQRLISGLTVATQMQENASQLARLQEMRLELEQDASPALLYPTTVSDIYIEDHPYFPKLRVFIGLAIVFGAVVGVIVALIRKSSR